MVLVFWWHHESESWFSKSLKLDQSYRRCYSNYSAIWIDIFNFCSFLTLFVRCLYYLQSYALNQCREVTPWFSWSLRSSSAVLPKSILTYLGFQLQEYQMPKEHVSPLSHAACPVSVIILNIWLLMKIHAW